MTDHHHVYYDIITIDGVPHRHTCKCGARMPDHWPVTTDNVEDKVYPNG